MALDAERHLDEEQIERYSMADASETEYASVEEHLLICQNCRLHVAEHDIYLASMRLAAKCLRAERPARRPAWSWPLPRLVPVFGAVAVLASVTLFVAPDAVRPGVRLPAVAVDLAATRGVLQIKAPAGRALKLNCDLRGLPSLPSYRLEVVDSEGRRVTEVVATSSAQVPGLPIGIYFIRIYAPSGELLREYGLEVGAS